MFWRRRKNSLPLPVSSGGFSLGTGEATPSSASALSAVEGGVANSDYNASFAPGVSGAAGVSGPSGRLDGAKGWNRPAVPRQSELGSACPIYILPAGYCVTGSIFVKGELRLDGELAGRGLVANRVRVTATGRLRAPTDAREIIVEGSVAATLRVTELLEIRAGGEVRGQVEAGALKVNEGAILTDATCTIAEAA